MTDHLKLLQTDDGSLTIENTQCAETYHSRFGANTESRQVYLGNSGVIDRFSQRLPTKVLEIGFGTGLNFILTAATAYDQHCALQYVAIEYQLPPIDFIEQILQHNAPHQTRLCDTLIKHLASAVCNNAHTASIEFKNNLTLSLHLQDALTTKLDNAQFDAIYLDAFSSRNNPDLWTSDFLTRLCKTLHTDGILATYSVNRAFRDALHEAGFTWTKHRGPNGKREVITARRAY